MRNDLSECCHFGRDGMVILDERRLRLALWGSWLSLFFWGGGAFCSYICILRLHCVGMAGSCALGIAFIGS